MNNKNITLFALILCALVILLVTSCNVKQEKTDVVSDVIPHNELNNNSRYYNQQYEVYTLEGCEYIVVGFGKEKWGSHKGNCKNPIHKTQDTQNGSN